MTRNKRPSVVASLSVSIAIFVLGSLSLSAAVLPGPAGAEESWGYDLGHELMSTYCPWRTLATCPSPQAAEQVQWIVTQEAAGVTREQVLEKLVDRFGEEILGAPPAEGFTLWAYILPVAGFVLGGGLVFLVLWRIVKAGDGAVAPMPGPATAPQAHSAGAPNDAPPTISVAGDESDEELARLVDSDLERRA